jgi:tetratricopeptide (TPR) repeat protein
MSATGDGAVDDVNDDLSVEMLFKRAAALNQAHRWQDAVDCFDEVLRRLEDGSDEHDDLRRRSLVIKMAILDKLKQPEQTVLACDAFLARYEDDRGGDGVGLAAEVLWVKSRALDRAGARDEERGVLQKLISDYIDEPLARAQVSGAMYNEGIYLRDAHQGDHAVALWDELWDRFSHDPPAGAPWSAIRGQLAKSTYLAKAGQLDTALLTCERMLAECRRRSLPDDEVRRAQRRCVAIAQRDQGVRGKVRRLLKRS